MDDERQIVVAAAMVAEDYPEAQARLLYREGERLEMRGIRCELCAAYLAGIRPGEPLR